jgi:diadenosine tetraphosphate (Ap4A) HIT family hydrolase
MTSASLPLLEKIEIVVIIQVIGFNVGINAGASAGQAVFHVHVHLIPRRDGDIVKVTGEASCQQTDFIATAANVGFPPLVSNDTNGP